MSLKCDCGGTYKPKTLAHFDLEPLTGVAAVLDKVTGLRCTKCGDETLPGLVLNFAINALALGVAKAPVRVDGPSARFLRKRMGLTQAELAAEMGVDRVTVAKWETTDPIAPHHDFILKTMMLQRFVHWRMIPANVLLEAKVVKTEQPRAPANSAMLQAITKQLRSQDVERSRMARVRAA